MPSLVSPQRVLVLALILACVTGAVTTLINGALLDPRADHKPMVLSLILAMVLGFCISYGLGYRLMKMTLASQKLEQIASYDFLTGALTRARFFAQIAAQPNLRGAFLVFDMNDFKRINDSLGHAAGDQALVQVAQAAQRHLGPDDCLCRLGGDEFLAFFAGLEQAQIHARARKIAMEITACAVGSGAQVIGLSASFGLAVLEQGQNIDAAIAVADTDLYRAKSIYHRRHRAQAPPRLAL